MAEPDRAGLCYFCRHSRRTENDRGSVFYLCALSRTDSRFAKYPQLPVVHCLGYARRDTAEDGDED